MSAADVAVRAAETGPPRGVMVRAGWGLLDQIASSGTNVAIGVIVARTLPIEDFGAFSIAFRVASTTTLTAVPLAGGN